MPTHRPEIRYRVAQTSKDAIDNDILALALSHPLQHHERGIIFVLTTTCCDELAEASGFPKYHGQLTNEERSSAMLHWRSGKSQWIVGTLAMAQGIDVRNVRIIINREISWVSSNQGNKKDNILSVVHFAQMSGRAGRDGQPSVHHLLYSAIPSVNIHASEDHLGQQAMLDFASLKSCRRRTLSIFLDGIDHTCLSMLNVELCDVCLSSSVRILHYRAFFYMGWGYEGVILWYLKLVSWLGSFNASNGNSSIGGMLVG
ncbi:P-loop containing nucleoside triphosphate hydrolase protein [Suillus lakei]|nr:P-loop containing nucleoside triphosphate hydrolase protein [Suillus lakei]